MKTAATYSTLIGIVLRELRKQRQINQDKMADEMGLTQATWSKIENGKSSLSIPQLAKAAQILGATPSEITDYSDRLAKQLKGNHVDIINEPSPKHIDGIIFLGAAALVGFVTAMLLSKK